MNTYSNTVINYAFRVVPLTETEKAFVKEGYTPENEADLKETLKTKKVRPMVGKMMVALGVETDYWRKEYDFFAKRNRKVIAEVSNVFKALKGKGQTRIIAYENFGAMLSAGTDTALFSSGDVDLFADVKDKEAINRVMEALGYKPTNDIYHQRSIMTEYLKEDGVIRINIDWIILRRMMFPIRLKIDDVIDWNNLRTYKDTFIKLPSVKALLYLCMLRIAVHGFSRSPDVRLYIDAHNVACVNPDWEKVLEWAKRDGNLTKFTAVSYIAHYLNGVSVPEKVLKLAEEDKYAQKIISICYDKENRSLKYDPAGKLLFEVEAASDNRSLLGELMTVLFPSSKWLTDFYLAEGEPSYKKYINYYRRLIGK